MRVVRTLVSEDDLETVLTVLDEYDIDYVVVSEEGDGEGSTVVEFPLPTQAVERILDELRDAGFPAERYTVVAGAESVVSEHADEMEERFITGEEEDDSIATEEVRSRALDLTPSPLTYYSMTLLSALVATAGLLLDSPPGRSPTGRAGTSSWSSSSSNARLPAATPTVGPRTPFVRATCRGDRTRGRQGTAASGRE